MIRIIKSLIVRWKFKRFVKEVKRYTKYDPEVFKIKE